MKAEESFPLVEVTRGDIVESIQFGAFTVVDSMDTVITSAGSPGLTTYPRSSMKPFQAIPFIEIGGDISYNFTEKEIAIMCASHAGTDLHYAVLQDMHKKIGTSESDLACGVHWPGDLNARKALRIAGKSPDQFHHNCSGKHTGMLAHARLRGLDIKNYLDPLHPVQVAIRETLAQMVGMDPDDMPMGTDGCSAPVYAIPLKNMAKAVALLAEPAGLAPERAEACRKISRAMMAHPVMVAGPGKFDTDLMQTADGKVFSKAGAEGYQIIGVMPGAIHKDSPGLGIAIKISDGDFHGRARASVSLTILSALGVLTKTDLETLSAYGNIPVKNWRGFEVGEIRPVFSLPKNLFS
jgi:L-asparaginase II